MICQMIKYMDYEILSLVGLADKRVVALQSNVRLQAIIHDTSVIKKLLNAGTKIVKLYMTHFSYWSLIITSPSCLPFLN